jgi:hypothetical protein
VGKILLPPLRPAINELTRPASEFDDLATRELLEKNSSWTNRRYISASCLRIGSPPTREDRLALSSYSVKEQAAKPTQTNTVYFYLSPNR